MKFGNFLSRLLLIFCFLPLVVAFNHPMQRAATVQQLKEAAPVVYDWDLSSNTVLHYKCNGTSGTSVTNDGSSSTAGTSSTDLTNLTATGKINNAFEFTASSSEYVDTNQTFQSTFQDEFSIGLWIKPDDGQPASNRYICGSIDVGAGYFYIFLQTDGKIYVYYTDGTNNTIAETNSAVFADSATSWTNLVVNVSATQIEISVNGISTPLDATNDGDMSSQVMSNWTSANNFYFGANNNDGSPSLYFDGVIDDFRIQDRVLTQTEITGIWNEGDGTEDQQGNITDTWTANNEYLQPLDPYSVAYWKAEDTSDSDGTHTLTNNNTVTFTSGKHNNAFTLDGTNQTLSIGGDSDFGFSEDFTISCWVNYDSSKDGSYIGILASGGYESSNYNFVIQKNNSNQLEWRINNGASNQLTLQGGTMVHSTWYHCVVSRINGTVNLYLNSSSVANGSNSDNINDGATNGLVIGDNTNGVYWYGQIDEVFILKGYGMTSTEVGYLYNSGTGAFRE